MPHLRVALLATFLTCPTFAADLKTTDGMSLTGELVGVSETGVVLDTEDGRKNVPLRQMLLLDLGGEIAALDDAEYTVVELVSGTRLHCTDFSIKGTNVDLKLFSTRPGAERSMTVPLREVFFIARDAVKTTRQKGWGQLLKERANRDMLVFQREASLDGLPGTAGEGSEDGKALNFKLSNGRDVPIQLSRLQGIIFSQPPKTVVPPTICKVIDVDGNVLFAKSVSYADGSTKVETVGGLKVEFADTKLLAKFDFSQGNLTYLSDMNTSEEELKSTLTFGSGYRRDTNLDGKPIKLGGESYAKGLSIHPDATLVYTIDGDYEQFKVVIGTDDSVVTDSHVKVSITADGRPVFESEIKRGDEPKPVAINVKGVDVIRITIESAREFDLGSQVSFADAKLSK